MKLIFLDIDGVLNTSDDNCYRHLLRQHEAESKDIPYKSGELISKTHDKYGNLFDDRAVKWLQYVVETTGAKIVISSTWRFSGLEEMQSMWSHRELPGEVIGITPSYRHCETGFEESPYEDWRGQEIKLYLDRLAQKGEPAECYVILDDDADMLPSQEPCFVKCDARLGITYVEVENIVKVLNTEIV